MNKNGDMQDLNISRRLSTAIACVGSETSSGLITASLSVQWREVKALCPVYVQRIWSAGLLLRFDAVSRQRKFLYKNNREVRLFAAQIDFDVGLKIRR